MMGFRYSDRQRREILAAIPLREGADREAVIDDLTKSADNCMWHRDEELGRREGSKMARAQLNKLQKVLEALDEPARKALSQALGERGSNLNNVEEATRAARNGERKKIRGRPRNDSAVRFAKMCRIVWIRYADSRPPPKKPAANGPFARFVQAAMPKEIRPPTEARGNQKVTGVVKRAIQENREVRFRTKVI